MKKIVDISKTFIDLLESFLTLVKSYPVVTVKYIIVAIGLFTTFANLFDCITKGAELQRYFLYVGVLGATTAMVALVRHNAVLCFVLILTGVLSIIDTNDPGNLNFGILWIIYAKRIAKHLFFSIFTYFIICLSLVSMATIHGVSPADTVNLILASLGICFIDYVLSGDSAG